MDYLYDLLLFVAKSLVLVLAKRLKQERGRLVLCAMQPHVHEVFDISGFLAILDVQATRQEALARL